MTRLRHLFATTVVALPLLAGCAAGPSEPPTDSGAEPAPVDQSSGDEFADSWLATAAEQFAQSQDPKPTVRLSSETAVEFTFPNGSIEGTDARSDCQIAMLSVGEEYELTMTYPDGSVVCSDILG